MEICKAGPRLHMQAMSGPDQVLLGQGDAVTLALSRSRIWRLTVTGAGTLLVEENWRRRRRTAARWLGGR